MSPSSRVLLPAVLATFLLAACGGETPVPATAPPVSFETLVVEPRSSARERSWDGVVEAVNQATLSAQTAGRVLELPFDVNDYVEAGQVVVRFTDVEQVSAQRRASAALNAAHPDVRCWTAAIDSHLNEHGYIIPGLGDAGDKIFGTKDA